MSSDATRFEEQGIALDFDSPLLEETRLLESIERRQALPALVTFSALHEELRNRRPTPDPTSARAPYETESLFLDEVLQLICERIHTLTGADGIVIALAQAVSAEGSAGEGSEMLWRAAAGPMAMLRDTPLLGESVFLRDCLETGCAVRSDDCDLDERLEFDFARQAGARSTVLIPLRGRRQILGVLQVVSRTPRAFSGPEVHCFDLFAELVLSALKPEDQDRRVDWLSDVAGEVLRARPEEADPSAAEPAAVAIEKDVPQAIDFFEEQRPRVEERTPAATTRRAAIHAATTPAEASPSAPPAFFLFRRPILFSSSHPGLNVVLGLTAMAALFSAGAWWGMTTHGRTPIAKVAATLATATVATLPQVGAPPAPPANLLYHTVSDDPAKPDSGSAPLTAIAENQLATLPKVTGVRHWSSSVASTVVIDLDDQVPYEVHRLMSPERIYFDLHDTALTPELDGKTIDIGDPSLTRVRVAQPVAGVTRVVLDTKDGSNFSVSMESSPYRLVVELRGSDKTLMADKAAPKPAERSLQRSSAGAADRASTQAFDRTSAPPNAAAVAALSAKSSGEALPLPAKTAKIRIVLDAGHGGWDLGSVGREGLLEKDLVLDVTERLGKLLAARLGSDVMFTRTDDNYVPLEERADFANQAQADLFVSVHANYSAAASARGVETYYTNAFSAPVSKEVSAELGRRSDGTAAKLMPVSLSAGGLHEKIEESRRLASTVQRSLYSALSAKSPNIRDRGIKDASFVVLTGTTMPAILTEISFVSSPADERSLQSEAYRQQIAEALFQGIARYEQSAPHAKIAQLQTSVRR